MKKGQSLTVESAETVLQDIAGVRAICYFTDDIYNLVNILRRQEDLHIVEEIDYIENPKCNGYRSYHMILNVPVYGLNGVIHKQVEVQLRTLTMDFWANMEHRIIYKKDVENAGKLKEIMAEHARTLAKMEAEIEMIKNSIQK